MKLTDKQNKMLEKHSAHHSKKHMDMMRKLMRDGITFTTAHKEAQKK